MSSRFARTTRSLGAFLACCSRSVGCSIERCASLPVVPLLLSIFGTPATSLSSSSSRSP